ncbi:FAD-binding protein [Frigidibacter sp. ROC022]|uniref:FAD-dependent oxidoreductase n=1 Tax=Frigidibacter sp. ROC022 TaxID=2971796 RepID=UPI00215B48DA|nr:FAD-binding oxidoreductase [Frigidibacter sp. ROC022]MCR8724954.1 FAD-binding oxidoreductase [Frigidibacter sp. ROC022]
MGLTRRALLLGGGALAGGAATRWIGGRNPSLAGTALLQPKGGAGVLNDASLLSETPIHRHLTLTEAPGDALVAALRKELREAAAAGRPVTIGAARHSMGGQAIPRDGHAITFDNGLVEPDRANGTYRVHAGARWSQVIAALDPIGFSPKVMQSNNDFGVASTFSVNAHGWPVAMGPMGSTVREIRMLLPDGDLVTASRSENADLFRLAMGGYGLIGLIVDLVVEMVPNRMLTPSFARMPAAEFAARFVAELRQPEVSMCYGRLNVERGDFFSEALLVSYRDAAEQSDLPPAAGSGWMARRARDIFRAQLGSDPVKSARWWTEAWLGPRLAGDATRNSLINEPVATLDDRDPTRTDILHEYFVAPERFAEFVELCRAVIPSSYQEMLNVTLRHVETDPDSVLAYATGPRIAAVMLFSQEMTARAEADMTRMTRALIDGTISIGGSYYLPYRPHATVAQLHAAYPRAAEFSAAKRALDPKLVLRNNQWDSYLGVEA